MKKIIPAMICLIMLTGCFGTFPATNKVIDINRGPESSVAQNAFFPILMPLYFAAMVGDMVIFNTAYFWKNSVDGSD